MRGILSDHNIEGHFNALVAIWEADAWRSVWKELGLGVESFRSLGISPDVSDAVLWRLCQDREIVLFTANRNNDGPDSLEATIVASNVETSLPVLTLANPIRFSQDRQYANEVAEAALDYLLAMDRYRGTGRLFL